MKKAAIFISGFILIVFGITLVLRHWDEAVMVFNGVVPSAIAVSGLVLMFYASLKK